MNDSGGAFRARIRAALASPDGGTLATWFAAPLVTALVADAREDERLEAALDELMPALERVGMSRGRQFVLLGGDAPASEAEARARSLRARLGLPVFVHDPARAGFVAGRLADGTKVELDDELREAEAIVTLGEWSAEPGGPRGGPALLCPGVAAAATRAAYGAALASGPRAAWALSLAAELQAPVDLSVSWHDDGRVSAARGRAAFLAQAREAGAA